MAALVRECEGAAMRDWQKSAVCVDAHPALFDLHDADKGTPSGLVHSSNLARNRAANAEYCSHCPVRLACLVDALEQGTKGTRGGELLTDKDIESYRRVRRQMEEGSL
jgi:hypothetical protein